MTSKAPSPEEEIKADFRLFMERGRFHHEAALWFMDPARRYRPDQIPTAMKSAGHHQRHAAELYARARAARDQALTQEHPTT